MIPDNEQEFARRMALVKARAVAQVNGIDANRVVLVLAPPDEQYPGGVWTVRYVGVVNRRAWETFHKLFTAEYCAEFDVTADGEPSTSDEHDDGEGWKKG